MEFKYNDHVKLNVDVTPENSGTANARISKDTVCRVLGQSKVYPSRWILSDSLNDEKLGNVFVVDGTNLSLV